MPFLDIFQIGKVKSELEQVKRERDQLRLAMSDVQRMEAYGLKKAVDVLVGKRKQLIEDEKAIEATIIKRRQTLEQQIGELNTQISFKQREVIQLDDEALLQSFGFYKPRYSLTSSAQYKRRLEQIRAQQASMIKAGTAVRGSTTWTVNNSAKEGARLIKDYVKLILRSFNNECDASITNVKFSNVKSIEKKLTKAYEALNKLGQQMSIDITQQYLNLKLEELYLCYEYQVKKQEEKEEQRLIRERMREEAKLLKEIEEAKSKLQKEAKHFNNALADIKVRILGASSMAERQVLEVEKSKIEESLTKVSSEMLTVENREQNTRAGYVYIISNIGSFGEQVYKIGVTRRLDPQERIDELGSASVPFEFDVHAFIFSDDAPALEHALHKAFEHRRINRINRRREFFRITLDEIEKVVRNNFKKPVEFTILADAAEYRQSITMKINDN